MQKLIKKLQIKDGQKGQLLNIPDNLKKQLAAWPAELLSTGSKDLDYVLVFVTSIAEADHWTTLSEKMITEDGLLWCAYPKKSSGIKTDINRDQGWQALNKSGYRGVRMIAIDDTWSALRFRKKEYVK